MPKSLQGPNRLFVALVAYALLLSNCGPNETAPVSDEPGPEATKSADSEAARSKPTHGRFELARTRPRPAAEQEMLHKLKTLGYLGATNLASDNRVISVHDELASEGLGLYASGHAPAAFLIDRDGNQLHRWRMEIQDVWPEAPPILPRRHYFRDVAVYPNGDLVAIYSDSVKGVIKLDKDSNLLWANGELGTHHSIEPLENGDAYILTRTAHVVPAIHPTAPILEDFITLVDANGHAKRHVSLIEALAKSPYWSRWETRARQCEGKFETRGDCADVFHTNSLQVLDGRFADRVPAFKAGNILTSFRRLNAIAVVDMETEEVVWMHSGSYRAQHDPRLLDNGNILVFDNQGRKKTSSVQEIDPLTGAVVWEYRGTEEEPFYTKWCGAAARLANGNTLITESETGRAFEVTLDRRIVWEFNSPHRAGDDGEYVGVLFEMIHLEPDFPVDWTRGADETDDSLEPAS